MVVTGIVQFGVLYQHYLALTDAVRAGARVAAVSRGAGDPVWSAQRAVIAAGDGLGLSPNQVDVRSSWQTGSTVSVTAVYPYSLSIFGIPLKNGALTSTTVERVE
jgi:hypothetical protein